MAADAKAPNANLKEDVGDKADRFSPEEEAVGAAVTPPRLASS